MTFRFEDDRNPRQAADAAYQAAYYEIDEFRMQSTAELDVPMVFDIAKALNRVILPHMQLDPLTRKTEGGNAAIHLENHPKDGMVFNASPASAGDSYVAMRVVQKVPEGFRMLRGVRLPLREQEYAEEFTEFWEPTDHPNAWLTRYPLTTLPGRIEQMETDCPDYKQRFPQILRLLCTDLLRFAKPPEQPVVTLPKEVAISKQWR